MRWFCVLELVDAGGACSPVVVTKDTICGTRGRERRELTTSYPQRYQQLLPSVELRSSQAALFLQVIECHWYMASMFARIEASPL
jgi:hypothetical protein